MANRGTRPRRSVERLKVRTTFSLMTPSPKTWMTTVSRINGRLQAQSAIHINMSAPFKLGKAPMPEIRLRYGLFDEDRDGQRNRPHSPFAKRPEVDGLRRRGPGQFQGMLRDRGVGGFGFAGDLHGREREFDAVLVEGFLDHRIGLAAYHKLLARQGHHLG